MSTLDWVVMMGTLAAMIAYGVYKSRGQHGAKTYLLADRQMPWYIVLLGVMATQASAITFLSAPGQAYTDGMRFVQYYFGLPIAMVVISITFIPLFQRLKVYTAYEFLEQRFGRSTRLLTAFLFLLSRGLSTGISIYAPSIILSSIMGWNIYLTNIVTGGLLIIYTFLGGAKAIAHTQKLQFLIILSAMAVAGWLVVQNLPTGISFNDALYVAGQSGKLNVITTDFDWKDKYNIWSGIIGGFFLALSYFGTDNSQVGRYISAKDDRSSRQGLLLNGIVKVPMQFAILLIGALLFAMYSFQQSPLNFNEAAYLNLKAAQPQQTAALEARHDDLQQRYHAQAMQIATQKAATPTALKAAFIATQKEIGQLRSETKTLIDQHTPNTSNDTNYIFLYFVSHNLPRGLVGLLFAVIFLASWGSISAALNSLAASSLMDVQLLAQKNPVPEDRQLLLGRLHTLVWGIFCIGIAMFAHRLGSLIEAVNVLGSLFYGPILGIFLVAFYFRKIKGRAVFYAAILAEAGVVTIYMLDIISFLWLNVIGAFLVIFFALLIQVLGKEEVRERLDLEG